MVIQLTLWREPDLRHDFFRSMCAENDLIWGDGNWVYCLEHRGWHHKEYHGPIV